MKYFLLKDRKWEDASKSTLKVKTFSRLNINQSIDDIQWLK